MRQQAKLKLGYYPLPAIEAERISCWLQSPDSAASLLDPCAGTGAALAAIAPMPNCRRYGVELDAFRANEAKARLEETIHGSVFDCHALVESFSLLYLNPPYDFEVGQGRNERMETIFLEHCFRWLKPGAERCFPPTSRRRRFIDSPRRRAYSTSRLCSSGFDEPARSANA
jgi:predicted RNA methylase